MNPHLANQSAPTRKAKSRIPTPLLTILTLSLLLSSACDKSETPEYFTAPPSRHIILVGEAKNEPTWPVLLGAGAAFARNYPRTTVEVLAPDTASPDLQQSMLRGIINSPADVVCVLPTEPLTLHVVIHELVQSGKPVVTIGRDAPGSKRGAHSGPDEFELGRAAAQACPTSLGGRSRTVLLLHAGLDDEATGLRYIGFMQEVDHVTGLQLLREIDCKADPIEAPRLVRFEAHKYPRAGGWVLLDDWPLRTTPPTERLLPLGCGIILCSSSPKYFNPLRDGRIRAIIAYDLRSAVDEGLYAAIRLCDPKRKTAFELRTIPVETITAQGLPAYQRRWEAWQLGQTTIEMEHASTQTQHHAKPESPM